MGLIALVLVGALIVFIIIGTPICMALGAAASVGILAFMRNTQFSQLVSIAYTQSTSINQLVAPLFVLMAEFLAQGGVAGDIFTVLNKKFKGFKAGLAISATLTSTVFAALCGSSAATTAAIGRISIKEMIDRGYDPAFTCGVVMAGGTLGIMIPPSMPFVLYGIITEASIAKLFMAGVIPGLMLSAFFCIFAIIRIKLNPDLCKTVESKKGYKPTEEDAAAVIEKIESLKNKNGSKKQAEAPMLPEESKIGFRIVFPFALIFFVLGSIYTGIATPTEAAGVGVLGSFLIVLVTRRLNTRMLTQIFAQASRTSAMILMLSMCGLGLTYVVSFLGIASAISEAIAASGLSRWSVMGLVYLMWLILGCLMDPGSMIVLTVPFILPTLNQLGFDTIWVGVVSTLMVEVGMITPPVGLNLFVTKSMTDVPMKDIIRGAIPYLFIFGIALFLLSAFPQLALWLPGRM